MAYRPVTPVSRPGELTMPSAPRYGSFEDEWGPPTRKSTRVSSQQRTQSYPRPPSTSPFANSLDNPSSPTLATQGDIPRSLGRTPTKKRIPRASLAGVTRTASGALSEESAPPAASTLQTSNFRVDRADRVNRRMTSKLPLPTDCKANMLPTPNKTPKKSTEKPISEMSSISRTLFDVRPDSIEEAFPVPKKDRKFSDVLDSEEEPPIKIYTDSKERVPELDPHPDNIFLDRPSPVVTDPLKKSRAKKIIKIPGEGEIPISEAVTRTDGCVLNFRGKLFFKFFSESQDDAEPAGTMMGESISAELDSTVPARLTGPLTRSLAPRLLFPTEAQLEAKKQTQVIADEEAATDIEEKTQYKAEERVNNVCTPTRELSGPVTPTAPRFGSLVSPPTTVRASRSSKKANEALSPDSSPSNTMGCDGASDERPSKNQNDSLSPFAAWRRTKAQYGSSSNKKRSAEELTKGEAQVNKRRRRGSRGSGRTEAA